MRMVQGYAQMKKRFFLSWTAAIAVLASCAGAGLAAEPSGKWYDQTADWMSYLRDDAQVWELTMPGSHDAGMSDTAIDGPWYMEPVPSAYFAAQYGPLIDQLNAGVRYFDLRPRLVDGVMKAWHGQGISNAYGETFSDMFDNAHAFLMDHPREIVFYHIGHWNSDADRFTVLNMLTNSYSDILFKTNENLVLNHVPLGVLRGKLVVTSEGVLDFTPQCGIWGRKSLGNENDDSNVVSNVDPHKGFLNIYNNYSDKGDFTPMAETQRIRWENNAKNRKNWGFMLNWTLTLDWAGIKNGAEEINGYLADEMRTNAPAFGCPFIVNCDYNKKSVCSEVIRYNAEIHPVHCRDAKGQPVVDFDIRPSTTDIDGMSIPGYDIWTDESHANQEVVIANGTRPKAVHVYLSSRKIGSIRPNDARLHIIQDNTDITPALDIPVVDGVADIRNSRVATWVNEQLFDEDIGAKLERKTKRELGLDDSDTECLLWTFPTLKGLEYVISLGSELDKMTQTGVYQGVNGTRSFPLVMQPGKPSGFMSVNVTWGSADR